ncbi:oligosaccharide flippase family protein, partial [Amphritea sp.]|uniref:oligosaccharide flippase family protein n=1 Tax=Amphritea sp. TaxID=1872502 RepID=UPI003568D13B
MKIISIYTKVKKYLHNTLWIMSDKLISLGVGFVVSVIVARYLGPEYYGLLSYTISIAALFAAAGHVGLNGLVVREIVKKPTERDITMGTSLGLKLVGVISGYLIMLAYAVFFEGIDTVEFKLIAIVGAALLFSPFDIVDFWFQAFVQARYVTCVRITGLAVGSSLRLICVFTGFG